jgi:hypothetical protein
MSEFDLDIRVADTSDTAADQQELVAGTRTCFWSCDGSTCYTCDHYKTYCWN